MMIQWLNCSINSYRGLKGEKIERRFEKVKLLYEKIIHMKNLSHVMRRDYLAICLLMTLRALPALNHSICWSL